MPPNPNRNQRENRHKPTEEAHSETSKDDDQAEESTETSLTRRTSLISAGLGLGLLNGLPQNPSRQGKRRWNQDVDANGNTLRNLGGLNMDRMDEGTFIAEFDGPNLEIDDGRLSVVDQLDVDRVETDELAGGVTDGNRIDDLVGDNLSIDTNRLNANTHWRKQDVLLEPSEDDVTGIEVEGVESSENEDLNVESDSDLVLSITGGQGAIRIETEGGHEIVLDDADGSESLSVEDSAGNSVEMDSATGELSISANEKITLDAPQIDLSADVNVNVESDGLASFESAGPMEVNGAIIGLNGTTSPAARQGDFVEDGVITSGSTTVFMG